MSKKEKSAGVPNPELSKAMAEIRRSNAAVPQESRNKRLRTKQTIVDRAIKESE